MKRLEYMMELRRYLLEGGLPEDELDDALRFYEEIFLDAGIEKESETAENLGNPKELARQILIDNNIDPDGSPEYFMAEKTNNNGENKQQNFSDNVQYNERPKQNDNDVLKKILIAVVTFPIWLPIVCAVGGTAFGVIVAIGATLFALMISGIAVFAAGVTVCFTAPPVGVTMLGVGLILVAINGLIILPVLKWLWRLSVRFFNWLVSVFRRIFGVRRVV